ncbi:MAG: leucine-rich repeat protein [Butyrivibrio sp.]|nr:leucine-rich repeat protein [Butyrivibrio sp.]
MKKNVLLKGIRSVAFAAGLTFATIFLTAAVVKPIQAKAVSESRVRENLSENERKIFDAYSYLDGRIKDKNLDITAENYKEYNSDTLYTMYTNYNEKKKYSGNELKFARRAYAYTHPTQIATFMAEMKFIYIKNTSDKYNCYAYLRRTGDNNYANEEKQLRSYINKITKNIDEDVNDFALEMQCVDMIVDNVVYKSASIDNRDLLNTAYGALVKHRASSQGYALAFSALLDEVDVENDILFSDRDCWNRVKISKWFEISVPNMDRAGSGTIYYDYDHLFNVSTNKMAAKGFKRVDYCKEFSEAPARKSQTKNNMSDYSDQLLKSEKNLALAILEEDGSTIRTRMTTQETKQKYVLAYITKNNMYNISAIVSSISVTKLGSGLKVTHNFSVAEPYLIIEKDNTGADRNITVSIQYWGVDGAVSLSSNLVDEDDNRGKFTYQITSENTVTVTGHSKVNKIKNLVIPSTVVLNSKVYKVTKIKNGAFKKAKKLETVIIGSNIKEIGSGAFAGKSKLIRVETRGGEISKIGKNAFSSADENTLFLLCETSKKQYKKLMKKITKVGGKNSVFKYRLFSSGM